MFDVVTATSHEPVDTGDALVFPYPAGTVAADFTSDGHKASSRGLMNKLALDDGDFTLSFGASFVTMTYFGSTSIPSGTVVRLELHRWPVTPASTLPGWVGYTLDSKARLEAANVPAIVDALALHGYTTAGDGGGALYKRVAAEPSHLGKIQSADDAWWENTTLFCRPEQFGAAANGTDVDDTAFLRMRDFMQETDAVALFAPRKYLLRQQIVFDGTTIIRGDIGHTQIGWDDLATSAGLKVALTAAETDRADIEGLSLYRQDVRADGTALHIDGAAQISGGLITPRRFRRARVSNINLRGTDATTDSFATGLHLESILGGFVDQFTFTGSYTTALPTVEGTGILLDGSGSPVDHHLVGVHTELCNIGIDIEDHEGVQIAPVTMVAVGTGIRSRVSSAVKPHLQIFGGHISSFVAGVDVNGASQSFIRNLLLYARSERTVTDHYQIKAETSEFLHVGGNTFVDFAGTKSSDSITIIDGLRTVIGPNIHQSGRTGVSLDAATDDTDIAPQKWVTLTTQISNLGTRTRMPGVTRTTVRTDSTQAIATATATMLSWDSTVYEDSTGMWASANPTRLVAHRTGVYDITYDVTFTANSTGRRRAQLFKNGLIFTPNMRSGGDAPTNEAYLTGHLAGIELTQDDYIEVQLYQDSGGSLDVLNGASASITLVR